MKKYEITEEQLKTIKADGCTYVEEWFPEAFETVLEVGKWYKKTWDNGDIDLFHVYGISEDGYIDDKNQYWRNGMCYIWPEKSNITRVTQDRIKLSEATEQEVFEALKNEAIKRGFVGNQYIDITNLGFLNNELIKGGQLEWKNSWLNFGDKQTAIFKNGVWGTVVPSITKQEAEKQLGKKIID